MFFTEEAVKAEQQYRTEQLKKLYPKSQHRKRGSVTQRAERWRLSLKERRAW